MSRIRVERITDKQGTGAPLFPNGIRVVGLTSLSNVVASTISIGGTLTYEDVTNVDSIGVITARSGIVATGVVTATSFSGSGANLTGIDATSLKDGSGNIKAQATSTGIGIGTATPANLLDIHGANGAGGLRLTETNHTNLNRFGRIFEYAGGLYFHSRNDTANGDFIFRGGLDGVEKLRIGSSSQIGIAGANYGTSGQVLTSGGASAAPSWADAAGGMSEYDVWSVTSNSAETTWNDAVIGSGSPSAINIARQTTTQNPRFVKIGTGMSYASGIWTFPSTGYWEVVFRPIVYVNGGSTLIQTFKIELTENNGTSWNEITRAHSGGGNNFEQPQTSVFNMVYITDVSNQKLRFIWDSEGSGHLQGAGGQLESNWVWKKVA